MVLSLVRHYLPRVAAIMLLGADLLISAFLVPAEAQVTPPPLTSSGLNTQVSAPTPVIGGKTQYDITWGTRPGSGPNLFHSFGKFDVPTNNIANFLNETSLPTTNILSRVAGGSPSNIFGTIQTTGFPGAHLFLMNPAGVVFGPTAQLNVEGSFHVSTANNIRMFDGTNSAYFHANPGNDGMTNSLLSLAPVVDFGFLRPAAFGFTNENPHPATITVDGSILQVPSPDILPAEGPQTLSIVGGDITIMGGAVLTAPGGRIQLASAASTGEVVIRNTDGTPALAIDSSIVRGRIEIRENSLLDVSPLLSFDQFGAPVFAGSGAGGSVLMRAGNVVIDGSEIKSQTLGNVDAPVAMDLQVDSLTLTNGGRLKTEGLFGTGKTGDIIVTANNAISISGHDPNSGDASGITTFSEAQGGNVKISGSSASLMMDDGALIQAIPFGGGASGAILIDVNNISIAGGALVSSLTMNDAGGSITLLADSILVSGQGSDGRPSAVSSNGLGLGLPGAIALGDHTRPVRNLTVTNNGVIEAGNALTEAGNITVRAAESVVLSNGGSITSTSFNIDTDSIFISTPALTMDNGLISTGTLDFGRGGSIFLEVARASLTNQSRIDSSSRGPGAGGTITIRGTGGEGTRADTVSISGQGSGLFTNTELFAAGGSISVQAGVVTVSDGGTISAASNGLVLTATGGLIDIEASQVQLNNGAIITAKSFGPANAGSVRITVDDTFVSHNSTITTEAIQADGGDIHINAGRLIHLTNSEVTSTVGSVDVTTTIGGNIFIDSQFLILQNSRILANAFAGTGGNINIVAGVLLVDLLSVIDASSTLPDTLSPLSNLSGSLAPLPQTFLRAAPLLGSRCVARRGGPASSFVVAGRDAIPMEPGGLLPSPLYAFEAASVSASSEERAPTPKVHLGTDDLVALNLLGVDAAADCAP